MLNGVGFVELVTLISTGWVMSHTNNRVCIIASISPFRNMINRRNDLVYLYLVEDISVYCAMHKLHIISKFIRVRSILQLI